MPKNIMATFFFFIGILVIVISGVFARDYASGIAGFLYGGILLGLIYSIFKLVRQIF